MPVPSLTLTPSLNLAPGVGGNTTGGGSLRAILQASRVTYGGVEFGTVDDDGVEWALSSLDGWSGSPGSDFDAEKKPRAHGAWRKKRRAFLKQRSVSFGGVVSAPDPARARVAEDRLNAAVDVDLARFVVTEPGRSDRWAMVARDGDVLVDWLNDREFKWSAQVCAPDPRKYGDPIVVSTRLPSSSGGLTWPVTWPVTWTGVVDTGIVHIDNPGDIVSPVFLRIDGPVPGPRVRHVARGVELVLSSTYTVGAGSWLDVDMENRQVLEGGTASRNGYIDERGWFLADKGVNDIVFSAQSYNAAALLTVTVWPAYQ